MIEGAGGSKTIADATGPLGFGVGVGVGVVFGEGFGFGLDFCAPFTTPRARLKSHKCKTKGTIPMKVIKTGVKTKERESLILRILSKP